MKIISKEKAWIGFDIYGKFHCFEERNDEYYCHLVCDYFKFISDITVNEYNEIHSYNDQPALIYKDLKNRLCKEWFINGENNRLNPEKPCKIIKGFVYYFNDGSYFNYRDIRNNLR